MSITRLEGSADRRCRKWRIRASVKIDGKYRVVTETFDGTKGEAEAREAEMKRERSGKRKSGTFAELSSAWCEGRHSRS